MDLSFSQLSDIFFTISDLFTVRQTVNGKTTFSMEQPRHTDALLLFSGCTSICHRENKQSIYIPQGALVYMPKNSKYMWEDSPALSDGTSEKLLFEFTLNYADTVRSLDKKRRFSPISCGQERIAFGDSVEIITTSHGTIFYNLFSRLISHFNAADYNTLDVFCDSYEIFNTISRICGSFNHSHNKGIIDNALNYLNTSAFPQKNVSELAEMCNVSAGYFERIFKEQTGVSPTEYINSIRLFHIKTLLKDMNLTLEAIAESLGFCDSGYLCRLFKSKTGMTPSEYRKLYLSNPFDI